MYHQRIAALTDQHLNRMALFIFLMPGVADQHMFVQALRHGIYRFHQRAEEGIGDVHHHHPDGVADLRCQRLRVGVGPVAQRIHRLQHRVTRLRSNGAAVIQHARDGRHRHASQTGNITNRYHAAVPQRKKRHHARKLSGAILAGAARQQRESRHTHENGYIQLCNLCDEHHYLNEERCGVLPAASRVRRRHSHSSGP